jgi:hypothetical protein
MPNHCAWASPYELRRSRARQSLLDKPPQGGSDTHSSEGSDSEGNFETYHPTSGPKKYDLIPNSLIHVKPHKDGRIIRQYTGGKATTDAIWKGQNTTRATGGLHFTKKLTCQLFPEGVQGPGETLDEREFCIQMDRDGNPEVQYRPTVDPSPEDSTA